MYVSLALHPNKTNVIIDILGPREALSIHSLSNEKVYDFDRNQAPFPQAYARVCNPCATEAYIGGNNMAKKVV